MMKRIFQIGLFAMLMRPGSSYAQGSLMLQDTVLDPAYYENLGERFRVSQLGISYVTMRDRALSPLRYQGAGFTWTGNRYNFKPQVMIHRYLQFGSTTLTNQATEQLISQISSEFMYARHAPLRLLSNVGKFYLGGFTGIMANVKLLPSNINNVLGHELALTVGPSVTVQLPLRVFRYDILLSDQLQLPILSLLGNTPYAWSIPATFEEGGKVGDWFSVGSWGTYLRINNQVNLDVLVPVRRRKKIVKKVPYRIGYRWDFISVAAPNLYQSGTHTLSIARIIQVK